jgi:tRNA threonylcarbamoyl adenosine modification protein YeaZ
MILLIDTTSSKIKLALDDRITEFESQSQSVDLPKIAAELLSDTRPAAIGVATGPGSFTGIRLGIAFAKGLALGYGIPVVGFSIFDIVAAGMIPDQSGQIKRVLAIDSGRGDYFVYDGINYRVEKEFPTGAKLISAYNLSDGLGIVKKAVADDAIHGDVFFAPVIPLYIRPSYVG